MKNKNLLITAFCVFITLNLAQAQNVGINTTGAVGDGSAMLDVEATDKGILIPRVALTARNNNAPIGAGIATSLLVYNTATAGTGTNAVSPGYYYWNGTIWMRIATVGDYWRVDGNAGTVGGINFIGTTDGQALDLRTNNLNRMRLMSDNADRIRIGIGTIFPTSYPASPSQNVTLLHIFDSGTSASDFSQLQLGANKTSPNSKVGELNFQSTVDGPDRRTAAIESFVTAIPTTNNQTGDLRFSTNNGGAFSEKMRLTGAGRLGLGTTNPLQGLHIAFPTGADAAVRIQNTGASGNMWDIQSTNAGHLHFNQMSAATPFNALHLNGANGYVGINSGTPSERLTVIGNFSLNGAFMPNDIPGNAGNTLLSSGTNTAPVWSNFTFENTPATTVFAKYFSSLSWTGTWGTGTVLTFIITDPNCTIASALNVSITGPWDPLFQGITIRNVVAENGQFRVTAVNNNGVGITGSVPIGWFTAY
jgi:hypothetical protein